MRNLYVSIAEGKKGFSRLLREALKKKQEIIVTKRGKPVAVIIPYDEYERARRFEGFLKIMETRDVFAKAGVQATEIFKESRKQLEKRP